MIIVPTEDCFYYLWDEIEEEYTADGFKIVLPQDRPAYTKKATVLAVGPDCKYLQVDDRILISSFTGSHLFMLFGNAEFNDGEKHRIARESEVIALVAEDEKNAGAIRMRLDKAKK